MFRRLAPCSRGGFETNGQTDNFNNFKSEYGANTFPHLLLAGANLKLFEWAPTAHFDYYQELFWDIL